MATETLNIVVRADGAAQVARQIDAIAASSQRLGTAQATTQRNMAGFTRGANDNTRAAKGMSDQMGRTSRAVGQAGVAVGGLNKLMVGFLGFEVMRRFAVGIIGSFAQFESALVGVGKTTNFAGQELEDFGRRARDLAPTLGTTAKEFLNVAQVAGQLGISGADNISNFTETVIKLESATDLTAESAAFALAKIINTSDATAESVGTLGNVLVALGNNMAATESQILAVANRLAGVVSGFGLTANQALGLSTAFVAVGVEAELASSTTLRFFTDLEAAVLSGGAELEGFAAIMGVTADEAARLFTEAPVEAFNTFVLGLQRIKDEGGSVAQALETVGLNNIRVASTFLKAATGADQFVRAQELVNDALKTNNALQEEFDRVTKTLQFKLSQIANAFLEIGITLGQEFSPQLTVALDAFLALVDGISRDIPKMVDGFNLVVISVRDLASEFTKTFVGGVIFNALAKTAQDVENFINGLNTGFANAGQASRDFVFDFLGITDAVKQGKIDVEDFNQALRNYEANQTIVSDATVVTTDSVDALIAEVVEANGGLQEFGTAAEGAAVRTGGLRIEVAGADDAIVVLTNDTVALSAAWNDVKFTAQELTNDTVALAAGWNAVKFSTDLVILSNKEAALTGSNLTTINQELTAALNDEIDAFEGAAIGAQQFFAGLGSDAQIAAGFVQESFQTGRDALVDFVTTGEVDTKRLFETFKQSAAEALIDSFLNGMLPSIGNGTSETLAGMTGESTSFFDAFISLADGADKFFGSVLGNMGLGMLNLFRDGEQQFDGFLGLIETGLKTLATQGIGQALGAGFSGITGFIGGAISTGFGRVAEFVGDLFADGGLVEAFANGGAVQKFAPGGRVSGPGGPRTDSIPAMLSAGEFVINAASVQKVGLPFLDAVNRSVAFPNMGARGFQFGGATSPGFPGAFPARPDDPPPQDRDFEGLGPGAILIDPAEVEKARNDAQRLLTELAARDLQDSFQGFAVAAAAAILPSPISLLGKVIFDPVGFFQGMKSFYNRLGLKGVNDPGIGGGTATAGDETFSHGGFTVSGTASGVGDRLQGTFENASNVAVAGIGELGKNAVNSFGEGMAGATGNFLSLAQSEFNRPFPGPFMSRDRGGPVSGGRGVRVGTPELFIPDTNGRMIPLGGRGGRGEMAQVRAELTQIKSFVRDSARSSREIAANTNKIAKRSMQASALAGGRQ